MDGVGWICMCWLVVAGGMKECLGGCRRAVGGSWQGRDEQGGVLQWLLGRVGREGGRERGMGCDLCHVLQDGWTPLIWSANEGHLEVAQELLKHGADVNAKEKVS